MPASNEWGQTIPEPMTAFTARVVNPKNVAIAERREKSRILGKRELRRMVKRRDELNAHLKSVGFWPAYAEFQRLMGHYRNLDDALTGAVNGQREPLQVEQRDVAQELNRLRSAHAAHIELFKEWKALCDRLNEHSYAVQRAAYEQKVHEQLKREAEYFETIIIETWARLGYKHDLLHKNKRLVHKPGFSSVQITGDAIWLKINTTQKTLMRGFKSVLPYGVRVRDLVHEDTLYELSMACQRQVTTSTNKNGAWIIVNRLDSIDGIMTFVTYDQVMRNYRQADRPYLPIGMGVGLKNEISWVFLAQYPHFLIGGTTGGGKSNIINVIICTLIAMHTTEEVQLVLIDLKEGLEFQAYEKVPHLLLPVVKTIEEAAKVLLQLEQLRAQRGLKLAEARVKDIDEYNEIMARKGLPRMPRVVVIFDEYAAIEDPFHKEQQKSIQASAMQLTNKARAAGIHLILCTQRPSVDVVPGHIKDNMAFRLAGYVPTQAASMTILGVSDAANLPMIKGRMMAMAGALKWQIQTPRIEKQDIDMAIKKAMLHAVNSMNSEVEKVALPEAKGSLGFGDDDLLHLVMDDYNGHLIFKEIWNQLKDTDLIGHNQLHAMCKALKDAGPFEYEGSSYRWKTLPGGSVIATLVEPQEEPAAEEITG